MGLVESLDDERLEGQIANSGCCGAGDYDVHGAAEGLGWGAVGKLYVVET